MSVRTWVSMMVVGLVVAGCGGSSGTLTSSLGVRITSPNGNVSVLSDTPLTFRARFSEGPGEVTPDTLAWTSSIGGQVLPQVNPATNVVLSAGAHVITASGTYDKKAGSASVTVTVGNIAVSIQRPRNLQHVAKGDTVGFIGLASVVDGINTITLVSSTTPLTGQRTASFKWTSSLDGDLGTDMLWSSAALSVGQHTITLTVTDSTNAAAPVTGTASITLVVNSWPEVVITAPVCPDTGINLAAGTQQVFAGRAFDVEDGDLTGTWTDTLTGATVPGNSFTFQTTTLGRHDVVFSATDSLGDTSAETCRVNVYPAGGSMADLFPSSSAINGALAGANTSIRFIGNDGASRTLVGNQQGLSVFDATPALVGTPYAAGASTNGAVVASGKIVLATANSLQSCGYAAGVLSGCTQLQSGEFRAAAVAGDFATSAVVAGAAKDGVFLSLYNAGTPVSHMFPSSVIDAEANDVAFVGKALYVATSNGLCVIDDPAAAATTAPATLCSKRITRDTSILPSGNLTSLAVDGTTLWIGTDEGLVRYDTTTGGMSVFNQHDGLVSKQVNDLVLDGDGNVWIATDGGVSRFDPATFAFTSLRGADWGGSNNVNAIYIDGSGTKWFGTAGGVVRYIGA